MIFMKKIEDNHLAKLNEEIAQLNQKIRTKSNAECSISFDGLVFIFVLHKHLKITVVFENHEGEAAIYFDRNIFVQYTHWHIDNNEAIKFVDDMIDDRLFFIESKILGVFGSQFTYKILSMDKYNLNKHRFLGKKHKNIFTFSRVIQGDLKKLLK